MLHVNDDDHDCTLAGAVSEGRQTLESLATAAGLLSDEEANSESPKEAGHQAAGSTAAQEGAQHIVAEGARGLIAGAARGKATPLEQAARPKRGETDTFFFACLSIQP